MGGKKRDSSVVEEVEDQTDATSDDLISEPKNKKMKKQKNKDKRTAEEDAVSPLTPTISASIKPMERRKKRKELDKERHRVAIETKQSEPKPSNAKHESQASNTSISFGGLPELDISVFKDLASVDASVREAAAETLVTKLQEIQKAYNKLEDKKLVEDELRLEAEKDDGLNDCAPSVRYAVRRLVRGVSSSRECARQGFSLALVVLVGTIPIKSSSLLKLIVDSLEISSSMKGQEVKDCLLGRLFAYGALARSGRLTEEWTSDKSTSCIKEFTSHLIALATKKRYLQEPAVSVILELVEKLPGEALSDQILEVPELQEWFKKAPEVGNPDALLLALRLREKIPADVDAFGKLLPNPFTPSKLFSIDYLSSITNCLKESTFCQPRVHSLWPVLLNILLPDSALDNKDVLAISSCMKKHRKGRKTNSSNEEIEKNLLSFCETVIEGSLLMSSHDRKHLAFDVLLLLFPRLPASFIPIVISYRVVQCLMDILSTKESWLYKLAQYFLKELLDWVRNDDVRRVAVIVALQKHSNGKFDSITRTKIVKELMAAFQTESGCMLFIQSLSNMFVDCGPDSESSSDQSQTTDDNSEIGSSEDKDSAAATGNSDFLKSWVVESMPSILKYIKLDPESKFRVQKEILKFLSVQGLFSASLGTEVTSFELQEKFTWPKATTSGALCRMCIEQIQSLLANAQKGEGPRALVNSHEANDLGSYFIRFFCTLQNIPSVSLFHSVSDEDEKALKNLQEMENKLSREEKNCGLNTEANKLHALRYLLIQLLLQVLQRPGEFSEAANELTICCKKAFPAPDILDKSGEDDSDGDGAPELMDVLVDTLLSLLPQSSAPLRSAIEQVFKYFCEGVTDDGLLRMLRVIKKDLKPARHQEAESENDEDDDDFLDVEEDEEVEEEETGETAESGDEQTDSSDGEDGNEGNAGGSEDSDDSDGGMDDDAMFRMDTYLAQIFKEKKNQTGGETAHSQLVLFKLRVLSLLEIYLHENPGKPQVLTVCTSLSQAFVNLHSGEGSEQLAQRIWGILQKKIFKAKDYPKGEAVQLPMLESLLERNLKLASKPFKRKKSAINPSKKKQSASWNRYKMINSLAQNSTFWILKIIDARNFAESELQKIFDIFRAAFVGYFDSKKSQIKCEFLKEIIKRRPWIGHNLFGFLLEKCSGAKSEFRRVEALDLVIEILNSLISCGANEHGQVASKKIFKSHMQKFCHLIKELVMNMPKKQARRAEVRKFCGKVFQLVSSHNLTKSFLKDLAPEAHAACQAQLGDLFNNLKKPEE